MRPLILMAVLGALVKHDTLESVQPEQCPFCEQKAFQKRDFPGRKQSRLAVALVRVLTLIVRLISSRAYFVFYACATLVRST